MGDGQENPGSLLSSLLMNGVQQVYRPRNTRYTRKQGVSDDSFGGVRLAHIGCLPGSILKFSFIKDWNVPALGWPSVRAETAPPDMTFPKLEMTV
jgi:hypothetical protein